MAESFTRTEQRILDVLSDGMAHTSEELMAVLWDELSGKSAVRFHICRMRPKLERRGTTIICELGFALKRYYRHVRLLNSE